MNKPKMLHLDIETSPNKVYAWGLWGQDIHIDQVVEPGRTLCWAAKWDGKRGILFDSVHKSSPKQMVQKIHRLLDEADVVVHYNGTKFDIPTLNKEFLMHGLEPPSPYKQIDLLKTARRAFRFPSNKLDYIAQQLGLGSKTKHKGMRLWLECMEGDPKAWKIMERYNKQDVKLLEDLYYKLLPWIVDHPNMAMYNNSLVHQCPKCGSDKLQKRGTDPTKTQIYQRYKCMSCGGWSRGRKTILDKEKGRYVLT